MLIVNSNRAPQYSLFYLGAKVLEICCDKHPPISLDYIYKEMAAEIQNLGLDYFYLTLDWLFLIGKITYTDGGVAVI